MSSVLVILDGAGEAWRGEDPTSLEQAFTPVLDALAGAGTLRRLQTIPEGLAPSAETGCAALLGWWRGAENEAVPAGLVDAGTVVVAPAGPVAELARSLGAAVESAAGLTAGIDADLEALAAWIVDALEDAERVVAYLGGAAAAGEARDAAAKVAFIERVDGELLVPVAAALHEREGVLEIAQARGVDPERGRALGRAMPSLRWNAADAAPEPEETRELTDEDLPVLAVPKRRASHRGSSGRRLTERWVAPLPVDRPA